MDTVKAGKPLLDLIVLCLRADLPVLLVGAHGVGKSEMLLQVAINLGIGFVCRDLSLMEPPDLLGLPKIKGQNTICAPPAFLPKRGKGLLIFEELNRCERYMRAPCLQLLTTRTLNDYALPSGWLPVAAVNPSDDGDYEVADLDPALLSRFVQVRVVPDHKLWLEWARRNRVHQGVIDYIESDDTVFNNPESNPRAWTYVSKMLSAADTVKGSTATLRAAVLGLVGDRRGAAFMASLRQTPKPLTAKEVVVSYAKFRPRVLGWNNAGRIDLVEATLLNVLKYVQPIQDYEILRNSSKKWGNLARFFHDLQGDQLKRAKDFFDDRDYKFPRQPRNRKGAAL